MARVLFSAGNRTRLPFTCRLPPVVCLSFTSLEYLPAAYRPRTGRRCPIAECAACLSPPHQHARCLSAATHNPRVFPFIGIRIVKKTVPLPPLRPQPKQILSSPHYHQKTPQKRHFRPVTLGCRKPPKQSNLVIISAQKQSLRLAVPHFPKQERKPSLTVPVGASAVPKTPSHPVAPAFPKTKTETISNSPS